MRRNIDGASDRDEGEPYERDRSEQESNLGRSTELDDEQQDEKSLRKSEFSNYIFYARGRKRTMEIGTTSCVTLGFATAIPPTALVTETAGVKTPSAIVRLVPKIHCQIG